MLLEGPSFKSQRSFPDGTRKEMTTSFVVSKDGTRIAYDKTGTGRAVVLLHGGGQSRRVWHDNGYVARLSDDFTGIVVDIRGHADELTKIEQVLPVMRRFTVTS